MPLPSKQQNPTAAAAARPATVARKRGKIRLLVPCGDRLPDGVLARLKQSPLEVLAVHPTLSGMVLRRSDVVLLGDTTRLPELRGALERLAALTTPVVAIGSVAEPSHGLRLSCVTERENPDASADAVLKAVVRLLKPLGAAKPSGEFAAVSSAPRPANDAGPSPAPERTRALAEPPPPTSVPTMAIARPAAVPTFGGGAPFAHAPGTLPVNRPLPLTNDAPPATGVSRSLLPPSFTLEGTRWLVLDDDVPRAHSTALCLRALGAGVELSGSNPSPTRLDALRAFGAVGAVVSDAALEELATLLGAFQRDPQLSWVRVVPVRWSELYDESTLRIDEEALQLLLLPHLSAERELAPRPHPGSALTVTRSLPAPALTTHVPAVTQVPDPHYGEDLETVPLMSQELPLVPRAGEAKRWGDLVQQGRDRGKRAGTWFHEQVWRPTAQEFWTFTEPLRPWVLRHKRLSALALSGTVLGLVVLAILIGSRAPSARADATEPAAGSPPPSTNAPHVEPTTPKAKSATMHAGLAQPEAVADTRALLADTVARPLGCERWVGSEPVARQSKQAMSAWRMARRSLLRGDQEQAEQRLCLSVHLDPRGPGTLDLVRFHFTRGDAGAALRWAKWATKERPGDPEAMQLLADAVHHQGNERLARALLLESMNITALDVSIIKSVANRYTNAGYQALAGADPAQAERLFRRATSLDEHHALATAGRARVALDQAQTEIALTLARRAAELDPASFEAQLVLGDAHAKSGNSAEARSAWLQAAALRPKAREIRQRLGS